MNSRVLPLEGGRNFRDLGGYAAADGRRTRWGVLYRSGTLGRLTAADVARLGGLGLRVVCDLRANDEREAEPSRAIAAPRVLAWDYVNETRGFVAAMRGRPGHGPDLMREAMTGMYRGLPGHFADRYRELFRELLEGNVPLVFHCTVGKDRTGVAAALILEALGVPRATVLEDYALTASLIEGHEVAAPANVGGGAGAAGAGAARAGADEGLLSLVGRLPPQVLAPLLAADPHYLRAALEAVEREWGSVEGYVERRLGLGPAAIGALRERYLEG